MKICNTAAKTLLGIFLLCGLALGNDAVTTKPEASRVSAINSEFKLLEFRVAPLGVYQSVGNAYSALVSWNPGYPVNDELSLGLDVGGTILNDVFYSSFLVVHYLLTASYKFTPELGMEVVAGAQTWTKHSTYFLVGGNVFYEFALAARPLSFLDRIFAGYSACFISNFYTSEVKVGVGLSF